MPVHLEVSVSTSVVDPVNESQQRFRGWWLLAFCTLSITLTTPGQTVGVSAFVEHIRDDLGLSDTSVSAAYLVGTLTGSLAMASVGTWIDRRGVRRTMLIIASAFSVVVAAMSLVQNIAMLAVGFVGIRMLGQGSLSLVSQTSVALWFDRYRGTAFGLSMVFSAAAMSAGPFVLTSGIDAFGWRWTWVIAGATVFIALVPATWLFMVDRPESIGQIPDGSPRPAGATSPVTQDYAVGQAMHTAAFWTLTATMVTSSALITGLTFHHFAMMEARGLSNDQAAGVFIPLMIGTVVMGFLFAWLTDRVSSRPLLALSMAALVMGMLTYRWVGPGAGAVTYGAVVGLSAGAIRALGSTLYAKWFGTTNIGAIRGVSTQFGVAASAIGPLLIAVGLDLAGSYQRLLTYLIIFPIIVSVAALLVPEPRALPRSSLQSR